MGTRRFASFTLILLVFFLAAAPVVNFNSVNAADSELTVQNTHSLDLIGQFGGSYKALAALDEYVYAAIGPRLSVINIADPTNPKLAGQTDVFPENIVDLVAQGTKVYASAGVNGLMIFDVSNPAQPVKAGQIKTTNSAYQAAIQGAYAYVMTAENIEIINISQPNAPQAAGSYPGAARDIAFQGSTMFVTFGDKISVLNISIPQNPSLIFDYNVPANEIELERNTMYVGYTSAVPGPAGTIYYGVLRILDITDLQAIKEIFFSGEAYPSRVPTQLYEMKLLNGTLYSYEINCWRATGPCALMFGGIDVSNPVNPTMEYTELFSVSRMDYYWGDFTIRGQHIFMASKDTLHIFDESTKKDVGQYASFTVDDVIVEDNVAFVAARSGGLAVVDVSDPVHPQVLDTYTTTVEGGGVQPAKISDIAVYGPYVYAQVAATGYGYSRVDILDVSNRKDIQRVGTAKWYMFPVRIHNGIGYYFNNEIGTRLMGFDLSNPIQPVDVAGSVATTISGPALSFWGTHAYIGGIYEGLHIINVANPQVFVDVKRLPYPIPTYVTETSQGTLYTFTKQALKVYDLIDPINPQETSTTYVENLGVPMGMKVLNNFVYLIEIPAPPSIVYTSKVRVFEMDSTSSPAVEVASYSRNDAYFTSVDVDGDLVFVSSGDNGLLILRHTVTNTAMNQYLYMPFASNRTAFTADCSVRYSTYLENAGWLDWARDGNESGTSGQGKRVEALQVELCSDAPENMGIVYQGHVQDAGWVDWVYEGQPTGTIGQQKRLEAVRLKLLNAPTGYHITYRVYVEGTGWTAWVSDGEVAGTVGQHKRIEAIEISMIKP